MKLKMMVVGLIYGCILSGSALAATPEERIADLEQRLTRIERLVIVDSNGIDAVKGLLTSQGLAMEMTSDVYMTPQSWDDAAAMLKTCFGKIKQNYPTKHFMFPKVSFENSRRLYPYFESYSVEFDIYLLGGRVPTAQECYDMVVANGLRD